MTTLGLVARERDAVSGALAATAEGVGLYRPLGWRSLSPYITAHRP